MQAVPFLERHLSADISEKLIHAWATCFFFFSFFAYVLSLPFKQFHIKTWDNPGVNLRDGFILCLGSATTLTALKS